MTKLKSPGATPMLRFPQFRTSAPWKDARLGELFSERQESGYTNLPLLSVTEADGVVPQEQTKRRNVSAADKSRYLRVVPNDIAYNTMRMWEGRSARVGIEGVISPAYTVCVPGSSADSNFFSFYFKTDTLIRRFRQLSQGLVKDTLNLKYEVFSRVRASVPPSVEEQRKIADCLTSLDEVIVAQARKVEALKAHKQGLMRQLFPREGATVPRLRFPEFHTASEWVPTKAGSLFENRSKRGEPDLPIYSVTMHDGMVKRSTFDRDFGDIEDPAGNKKALRGDIVYNMMRMWQGALGVAMEDSLVSPAYVVLVPLSGVVSDFFFYLFKLPSSLRLLTSHSRGLTKDRLRLYFDDFAQIPLRCPTTAEQQRIAQCLQSIDSEIRTAHEKLASLTRHKSALMQQLFPVATV